MKREERTDRILIAVALIILLMTSSLFYFDSWMWGKRTRGETIGKITARNGDVRMKFEDDLRWDKASDGQDLAYNDAIYAGAGSQADLEVGKSKMTVTENTLVVLRRKQDVNFMNLDYGAVFGTIAKDDRFVIETGNGKTIELKADSGAQVMIRRSNGKTQIDTKSGQVAITVDGRTQKIDKSSRLVLGDKSPAELQTHGIRILKPLAKDVIASADPTRIDFDWEWENKRAVGPGERFQLEFAAEPTFKKIHISKTVQGASATSMTVSQSLSLYYRVKGPNNQISATEKVNFIRLEKPVIVQPTIAQKYEVPRGSQAQVTFEFRRPEKSTVWYQIARDGEFKDIVMNVNTPDLKQLRQLPEGGYFARARADFGEGKVTGWSDTHPFSVEPEMEMFRLSKGRVPSKILIPNRVYPSHLYNSDGEEVKGYLAGSGFLKGFFPYKSGDVDEIKVQMETGDRQLHTQGDNSWPAAHMEPGRYSYKYQATKNGFKPSEWSASQNLQIAMEPVRPVGEAIYGDADEKGIRPAQWDFTPLLYANSYDVEVSPTESFMDPLSFKAARNARARTELPQGDYYWRARARDKNGRIISAFSKPYKLKDQPAAVPQFLAKNKQEERKPAATERTATRVERLKEKPWERSGWWAWLGAGTNYVDYRQSIPGRGTLQAHHVKGPSQYFEGGYTGGNGVGGVLSYKSTPGQFNIPDVPIFPSTFRWNTISLEGIARRTSPFSIGSSPLVYGLRAGVQQHTIPFLFLPAAADSLLLKNNQMTTASFGLLAELQRSKWTYAWLMRYQFPLTSKADGSEVFSMTPVFAFDGSLGVAYNITQRMKLGAYWYGQWHQFNFIYGDSEVTNSGFQSLFYSNIDLRLGLDF